MSMGILLMPGRSRNFQLARGIGITPSHGGEGRSLAEDLPVISTESSMFSNTCVTKTQGCMYRYHMGRHSYTHQLPQAQFALPLLTVPVCLRLNVPLALYLTVQLFLSLLPGPKSLLSTQVPLWDRRQ